MKKLTLITAIAILFVSCKKENTPVTKHRAVTVKVDAIGFNDEVVETSETFYFK